MSAGDITQPLTVRIAANERADTIDINALSTSVRANDDALARTTLFTPRNGAGTAVGLILTGFSLTLNPVPADGKVRLNTEVGVAIDSDGHFVIKPAGTIDVVIPAGGAPYQVYVYAREELGLSETRRFLPVAAPFTEFGGSMETTYVASFGTYVRGGNLATVVREDAPDGRTRALVLLCIATNTAGTVAITGYNASTAPNGTDGTNRLSAVTLPAAFPTTPYVNPSWRTLNDKVDALAYEVALAKWTDSTQLTPAAANNYGAYTHGVGGVDAAFRGRTVVTIGKDSDGIYGDIDLDDYANASLAIGAALGKLPLWGGTVLIKAQSALTMASNITLVKDQSVRIVGQSMRVNNGTPLSIDMSTFKFICPDGNTTNTAFILENLTLVSTNASATGTFVELHDRWTFTLKDCTFGYSSAYSSGAPTPLVMWHAGTTGALTGDVTILDSYLLYVNNSNVQAGILVSTLAHSGAIAVERSTLAIGGAPGSTLYHRAISLTDARNDVMISDCVLLSTGTTVGPFANNAYTAIYLDSTDNTVGQRDRRIIRDCRFIGRTSGGLNRAMSGVFLGNIAGVRIRNCDFSECVYGVTITSTTTLVADTVLENCTFNGLIGFNVSVNVGSTTTYTGLAIIGCKVMNGVTDGVRGLALAGAAGSGTLARFVFARNHFSDASVTLLASLRDVIVQDNLFENLTLAAYQALALCDSTSYTITSVRITGNTFKGCKLPAVNTGTLCGLAIRALASSITTLVISENRFDDIANMVYTAGGTMDHSVIRVLSNSQIDITVSRNSFYNIARTISGAGITMPSCIAIGGASWGSSSSLVADGISICENTCGDLLSACEPIVVYWVTTCANLLISDNNFEFDVNTLTVKYGVVALGGAGSFKNTLITDNTFRYTGNGGGAMAKSVLLLDGTFYSVGITGNRWMCNSSFGHAASNGILWSTSTLHYLTFDNNAAYIEGDTSITNTKFQLTVPVSSTSKPAFPAAANYYGGNNFNIYRP